MLDRQDRLREMGTQASRWVNLLGSNNCISDLNDCIVAQSCIELFGPRSAPTEEQMLSALHCLHQMIIKSLPVEARPSILDLEQRARFGHQFRQLDALVKETNPSGTRVQPEQHRVDPPLPPRNDAELTEEAEQIQVQVEPPVAQKRKRVGRVLI